MGRKAQCDLCPEEVQVDTQDPYKHKSCLRQRLEALDERPCRAV